MLACIKKSRINPDDTVYSYGQFYLTDKTSNETMNEIKDYAESGFKVGRRPKFLKRTTPYSLPGLKT